MQEAEIKQETASDDIEFNVKILSLLKLRIKIEIKLRLNILTIRYQKMKNLWIIVEI